MNKVKLRLKEDNDATIDASHIEDVIGQDEGKKKLSFFVKSHSKETPFPTLLFTGSQGLGKTFMSQKVADSLDRDLVEVNCSTIQTAEDFIKKIWVDQIFYNSDKPRTILFDEAHKLSFEITTLLLSFLNPNAENKNTVDFDGFSLEYNFYTTNIIFATTDAHMMFKPLLNRCEEIYFNQYTSGCLFDIMGMYLPKTTLKCDKKELAEACRGRARDAFILSQNVKRYCSMKDTDILTQDGWSAIRDLFGIHAKGLNSKEVSFLKLLAEFAPVSSKNVAIKLGINVNNVEEELEIRPRELGLIESTSKGRVLTKAGERYLNTNS